MEDTKRSGWALILIGLDRLVKAVALLIVAVELHRWLLRPDLATELEHIVRHARIDPGNRHVHAIIAAITGISPQQLHRIRLGSYLYAGLDLIEGVGLMLRQLWAEYMTTITTALFLPLEAYEIFHGHHHHIIKIAVFVLNVAIVVYLSWRLRRQLRLRTTV